MKRLGVIGLALLATFALSVVAASTAQAVTAPFWSIGGTRLVAGKTHNFDAKAFRTFELIDPFSGAVIKCAAWRTERGVLLGSNPGQPGKDDEIAVFSNCTVTGNGGKCSVVEPIRTTPLTSELVENTAGKQLLEEFKPTSGATVATIGFEGECTVPTTEVLGSVAAEVLTDNAAEEKIELGQTAKEATSWLIKFPAAPIAEALLVNTKGEHETVKFGLTAFGNLSILAGTALTLLANTKFEPERANWSPLP